MKRKTRTREHKDLQGGQVGALVEEAAWNRGDLVIVKIPKKISWNERDEKKHKNTETQRLTSRSNRCYFQTRWHSQMLFPCYLKESQYRLHHCM